MIKIWAICSALIFMTGCFPAPTYECDVYSISGKFYTTKQSNRHKMVVAWRYDDAGERRTFMFHRDRFDNCEPQQVRINRPM